MRATEHREEVGERGLVRQANDCQAHAPSEAVNVEEVGQLEVSPRGQLSTR